MGWESESARAWEPEVLRALAVAGEGEGALEVHMARDFPDSEDFGRLGASVAYLEALGWNFPQVEALEGDFPRVVAWALDLPAWGLA